MIDEDDPHIRLVRAYEASAATIWELLTTPDGIERWWAPDGFVAEVRSLDLRPGGELVYSMTATEPRQVEFMRNAGMPLSTLARKTFIEVGAPTRLAYRSLVDYVPDHEPYEHLTVVDLAPCENGVTVAVTMEPLHDEEWTNRLIAGRANELDNLTALIAGRQVK